MFLRESVLAEGMDRHELDRKIRRREVDPLYRGVYLAGETDDTQAAWLAKLSAHLVRGGPLACVSHRAAAKLHGLEGVYGDPEDVLVPFDSTFRGRPAIRTRALGTDEIMVIRELAVTTLARTLPDLRRFLSAGDFEVAFESALRGSDARRPDLWNESLLSELLERSDHLPRRRPGVASYKAFLSRRGQVRPTGSYAETRALQAFRSAGLTGLVRQPIVEVLDGRGQRVHRWFPDFGDLRRGVLLEIDGQHAHGSPAALDRDLQRQNKLTEWFVVVRWSATRVSEAPVAVGNEAARRIASTPIRTGARSVPGATITPNADGWTVCLTP